MAELLPRWQQLNRYGLDHILVKHYTDAWSHSLTRGMQPAFSAEHTSKDFPRRGVTWPPLDAIIDCMEKIDPSDFEKRLARISEIFADIAQYAQEQALQRCPYKNRFDQCTAQFSCRFQRKPEKKGELLNCTSNDQLDYRSAWEVDPEAYARTREMVRGEAVHRGAASPVAATMRHDDQSRPLQVGKTVFDYADELNVRVPTSCGRTGICHECVVEIKEGLSSLSQRSEAEAFLSGNYRLACQAVVDRSDQDIEFVLLRRTPKILTAAPSRQPVLDPIVVRREQDVLYGDEVIDSYRGRILGLAIDLGTTTIVIELVDLETGHPLYVASFENPQRFGGSDIMYRISYDAGPYQGELHRAVINTLNMEIQQMCAQLSIDRQWIYEIVVVGNSTMRELFFDHDVQSIGQKPYKSDVEMDYLDGKRASTALLKSARKLRIRANKNARVFGAPLIASHVGGDVVADLVAINMPTQNEVVMLVDAGTNTEVIIGHQGRLLAASCPAGPAFEGGLVTYGMPGCDGAIESVRRVEGGFSYETIGGIAPSGICGSGLIDLLAELRRHDLMSPKGVFAEKARELQIVPEQGITFSRQDASHLAQAKAANYCGQIILMRKFGVSPDQIHRLYLAGGFANYVDTASAVDIGFLAPVADERIVKVGNTAAEGARQMLLSRSKRDAIEVLVKTVEHIELETMPDFFDVFVEGCQFKPMEIPREPPES